LRRALLDAVTDGDFTSRSINEAFTQDELVAAIRDYMVEHNDAVPTLLELVGWAHDPRVRAKPGRRPLTQAPFSRFGGYPAVLRAAGVAPNVRRNTLGRVLAVTYRYSDTELREAVRAVGQKLGRTPREADYREARQAVLGDATRGNRSDAVLLPSVSVLKRRWGPWPNVLAGVGLDPLAPFNPRLPRRPRYAPSDHFESLRKAWVQVGPPFTAQAYGRWRHQEQEAAAARGEYIEIPSVAQVVHFFGSWRRAVADALPRDE
jgi:hypothetical protein